MELYSYNKDKVKKDYNCLLDRYNRSNEQEQEHIYEQLFFIDYIDKKILSVKNKSITTPKNYLSMQLKKEKEENDFLNAIKYLTEELCYNLVGVLNKVSVSQITELSRRKITKEQFYKEILSFFDNNFKDESNLVIDTFTEGRIRLKRSLLSRSAYIIYLESLKKFYIDITYFKNLSLSDASYTIHEFGHAMTFKKNNIYETKDPISRELIASLYEIMYLKDIYSSENIRLLKEVCLLLKSSGLYQIIDYLEENHRNKKMLLYNHETYLNNKIIALYGYVIALTIIQKYQDNTELLEIINILKSKVTSVPTFDLLKNIEIKKEDVVDTTKDLKKLILTKN